MSNTGAEAMPFSRQETIAHVNRSPAAVAVHDKEKWLDIFSRDAVIEDPVGSAPHRRREVDSTSGQNAVSRFYDTFIAPNTIHFDVKQDIVCDNRVVRDLNVNIDMGRVNVSVPMHLLYELVNEEGQLKIARLAAHWELFPMLQTLFSNGASALPIMASLSWRMLKNQGILGTLGFASALNIVANRQKSAVTRLLSAINRQDQEAIALLVSNAATFNSGLSHPAPTLQAFLQPLGTRIEFSKILAAGRFVSVTMTCRHNNAMTKGVGFFEFDRFGRQIVGLHFYHEPPDAQHTSNRAHAEYLQVENVP